VFTFVMDSTSCLWIEELHEQREQEAWIIAEAALPELEGGVVGDVPARAPRGWLALVS